MYDPIYRFETLKHFLDEQYKREDPAQLEKRKRKREIEDRLDAIQPMFENMLKETATLRNKTDRVQTSIKNQTDNLIKRTLDPNMAAHEILNVAQHEQLRKSNQEKIELLQTIDKLHQDASELASEQNALAYELVEIKKEIKTENEYDILLNLSEYDQDNLKNLEIMLRILDDQSQGAVLELVPILDITKSHTKKLYLKGVRVLDYGDVIGELTVEAFGHQDQAILKAKLTNPKQNIYDLLNGFDASHNPIHIQTWSDMDNHPHPTQVFFENQKPTSKKDRYVTIYATTKAENGHEHIKIDYAPYPTNLRLT